MRWSLQIALRFMRFNLVRNISTLFGVALGIALATVLLIAGDSVKMSLDEQLSQRYGKYDIQFGYQTNENYLTSNQVDKIYNNGGIAEVSKTLIPYSFPIPKEVMSQPSYWGVETHSPEMRMYQLVAGRYPEKGAEVAITEAFANRKNLKVGDKITFPFPPHGEKTLTIIGILKPPVSRGGGNTTFFSLAWIQETTNLMNQVNLVQLKLKEGTDKALLVNQIKNDYPDVKIDARSYIDKAYKRLNFMRPLMYSVGVIALLVSSILVMGSFILSVQSRTQQWATLRAIGSTSSDLVKVVLMEALFIGIVGSFIGVVGGSLISSLSASMIGKWAGIGSVVITYNPSILITIFMLGTIFSLIGAIFPALSTRNVPPAQALRPGVPEPAQIKKKKQLFGVSLMLFGLFMAIISPLIPWGIDSMGLIIGGLATLFVCIGLLLSISQVITWIITLLSRMMTKILGIEATLAGRNVIRYQGRAGFAVITLGLGLMVAMSAHTFLDNAFSAIERNVKKGLPADFVIKVPHTEIDAFIKPELKTQLLDVNGIEKIAAVSGEHAVELKGFDFSKVDPEWLLNIGRLPYATKESVEIFGTDIVHLKNILSLNVVEGHSLEKNLNPGEAFLTKYYAETLGLNIGDTITVQSKDQQTLNIKIVSIVEDYPMVRGVPYFFVDMEWGIKELGMPGYKTLHVKTSEVKSPDEMESEIQKLLQDKPYLEYVSYQSSLKDQKQFFSQQLFLIRSLIGVVLLISGIGLMNAIISSLHERHFEIGIFQAIGALPQQILRIILLEGIYLGLSGGIVGIIGGAMLAYFLLQTMEVPTFVFPALMISFLLGISILLGVAASFLAAVWSRRLSPSELLKAL